MKKIRTTVIAAALTMITTMSAFSTAVSAQEIDNPVLATTYEAVYDTNAFQMSRMAQNYVDPAVGLVHCSEGYKTFTKKYNNSDFINMNKNNTRKRLSFTIQCATFEIYGKFEGDELSYDAFISKDNYENRYTGWLQNKQSSITKEERDALVDYVRTTYPGVSLVDFLCRFGVQIESEAWSIPFNEAMNLPRYDVDIWLITNDAVCESFKKTGEESEYLFFTRDYYHHKYGITGAVNIKDPSVTEKPITIAEFDRVNNGGGDDHFYNSYYYNRFFIVFDCYASDK